MTYYKSIRYIDGKLRYVISDDDDNIIQSPTKEQIMSAILDNRITKRISVFEPKGRKCCKCGSSETYTNPNGGLAWYHHECDKENCTEYLCKKCNRKSNKLCRTNNLSVYSETGKGLIGEVIFAKVRGLKVISIDEDRFNSKFDLSSDPEYGTIQSKLKSPQHGYWHIYFGMEHNFDHLGILCMSKDMKKIKRLYIIPEGELYGLSGITITKNGIEYEKFRINDICQYNDAYNSLMNRIKDNGLFDIEDIKLYLSE